MKEPASDALQEQVYKLDLEKIVKDKISSSFPKLCTPTF